jgi:putative membrane protein
MGDNNMRQNGLKNRLARGGIMTGQWLLRILQGALIGGGAILPGISGGVLSVTFGLYQPLMALIAHPAATFKKDYQIFVPFFIGWLAGFLGLARIVELLFRTSSVLAIFLFIGLIVGTLPSLFRQAAKFGTSSRSWTGFTISLIVLYGLFTLLQTNTTLSVTPGIGWFFFCGIVWGFSLVIPGLSSSSVLIFMGLYQAMTTGIADLDLSVILPLLAGIVLTVALSARLVNYLMKKYYAIFFHVILGIIIASTLMIIPTAYSGVSAVLTGLASFAAGCVIAWFMSRYGERVRG